MNVDVVIEVRGGLVQVVYARNPNQQIVTVDWDNAAEGDQPACLEYPSSLDTLPAKTAKAVERCIEESET